VIFFTTFLYKNIVFGTVVVTQPQAASQHLASRSESTLQCLVSLAAVMASHWLPMCERGKVWF
jgi:hypothetical protein